jgi:hypothetical protein
VDFETKPTRGKAVVATLVVTAVVLLAFALKAGFLSKVAPGVLELTDAVEIFYTAGTRVSTAAAYPKEHEIRVDGEVFIRQPAAEGPLIVRTRLLTLTARGPAEFRVTARSNETGEQVEVLSGTVEARKAYPSAYRVPDVLASGEMSMVNQTIDLMEKEKTDLGSLRAWRDTLLASMPQKRARH